jgi:hypothetical protein
MSNMREGKREQRGQAKRTSYTVLGKLNVHGRHGRRNAGLLDAEVHNVLGILAQPAAWLRTCTVSRRATQTESKERERERERETSEDITSKNVSERQRETHT